MKSLGGAGKIRAFLEDVIKSDSFQHEILQLRIKYDIPLKGYKEFLYKPFVIEGQVIEDGIGAPPSKWEGNKEELWGIGDAILRMCQKYRVSKARQELQHYLFYNCLSSSNVTPPDLIMVDNVFLDRKFEKYEKQYKKDKGVMKFLDHHKMMIDVRNEDMPTLLRISPYASIRDIIDFVEKESERILWFQDYAQKKMGTSTLTKIKRRNSFVQERNQFVYENKGLPLKDISKLLSRKYGDKVQDLTVGHISKIISLENKKRKEV